MERSVYQPKEYRLAYLFIAIEFFRITPFIIIHGSYRRLVSAFYTGLSYLAGDHCLDRKYIGGSVVFQYFAWQHVADAGVEPHQLTLQIILHSSNKQSNDTDVSPTLADILDWHAKFIISSLNTISEIRFFQHQRLVKSTFTFATENFSLSKFQNRRF